MFAFNFVFWMFGALLIGIGTYAAIENWKQGQGNSGTITVEWSLKLSLLNYSDELTYFMFQDFDWKMYLTLYSTWLFCL